VAIHCMAGVSRSVTLTMMYLIKYHGMNAIDALLYVKNRRPIAGPNLSFKRQIDEFYNRHNEV